ncbi:N-acetylmuramoyl-L-alanine amidase [Lusitaniella coriacea LEGE 07157]|uniref:N-acetylmuramoyl-L-alanine amidase n=1 Tax=Lusitaniella coriacea LEGE 07157 TaxID=945747 RepID=A0A8J7AMN8_9CYAN|nr:N-acetylmuramoyl-L-alanine amidase [Lusitaniella coriacea]MBE9114678.1 N-acetylmuramoyl-L-alanine amidase [Lusitaniella coriacea LEGE 07157]
MKFGIDMGHNAPPDVGAASRFGKEDVLTKEVGTKVISKIEAVGDRAVNCTPSNASSVINSLYQRIQKANAENVDVYVSIHFNSFNGSANGVEVFAVSDAGRRIAQPVLDSIVKLGFTNRRVKGGSHLYVLRNTRMPGILIECCFLDSEKDMSLFDSEVMANAIVKGLTGKSPQISPETSKKEEPKILELQKVLNRFQIRDANGKALVEDGISGAATESATLKFHEIMGVDAGKTAGALTWKLIEEVLAQPTLRPNHAEGSAVKYVQFRLGDTIDGVYDEPTVEAVKSFQRRQNLVDDGIIGPKSWGIIMGKLAPELSLKIIKDTILKQEPINSSEIEDEILKYPIEEGIELPLHSWEEEGNHVKLALLDHTFNGFNTWYAFIDHIEIWKEGKPLELNPDDEQPIVVRTDSFHLPGFTSTFYLSDPIVPNGHFYWRDALHNGERIPKERSHVENIIALAKRMEDVRERLGGFPIIVTSWYRPDPWNSRVGGAKYSRHKVGQAIDFIRPGMTGRQMASRLRSWPGGMGIYRSYPNLLHLDIRPYRARWGGA